MNVLGFQGHALTIACLLLFVGCMGKSAQLGLHTWLPDAMEGPTPVSALIHAATMVTAGVFLLARCSPLFEFAPDALKVVTVIGACTAFFAATVGLVQNDIKKVIAYSTCSQLGYMFFACGVGAYSAAIFHLMTHAFFKALLFLGAGSVIHGLHDEQDMRRMGGVWKKMPVTYAYMWIGSLALAGIPLFAGYYSKDMILEAAFAAHTPFGTFAFWMGIVAAFMTAFYSWRLLLLTFHGTPRSSKKVFDHAHESPAIMNAPLLLLAVGAVVAGALGYHWLGMVDADGTFWKGAIFTGEHNHILEHAHHVPVWVPYAPLAVGLLGIAMAYLLYLVKPEIPGLVAKKLSGIYRFLLNKWYFDELYQLLFVYGAQVKGNLLWRIGDIRIIDGLGPNGLANLTQLFAGRVSRLQTGYVYHYALVMVLGLVAVLGYLTYRIIGL
jgi:NADH-quinone oxidoreductase subunit L